MQDETGLKTRKQRRDKLSKVCEDWNAEQKSNGKPKFKAIRRNDRIMLVPVDQSD